MHFQIGDATLSVLSYMDIPTIVVFSDTSAQDRKSTLDFLNLQFSCLLEYCNESEKKDFPARFKNNICFLLTKIRETLQKDDDDPKLKNMLVKVECVAKRLQIFYEVIPTDEIQTILQLNCKLLIREMFAFKKKEDYMKIRNQIIKMKGFYPQIKREDTINLFPAGYCMRYSMSEKDSYGNAKIVLSAKHKKINKVFHFLIEIEYLENYLQFGQKRDEKLEIVSSLRSERKIQLFERLIYNNSSTGSKV